jgi:hypothetical protein
MNYCDILIFKKKNSFWTSVVVIVPRRQKNPPSYAYVFGGIPRNDILCAVTYKLTGQVHLEGLNLVFSAVP